MSQNPLRLMITAFVFKGYRIEVFYETRDDTGESNLSRAEIHRSTYRYDFGWQATEDGLSFETVYKSLFIPYHRIRTIRANAQEVWNSNDPKKIPTDIPLALESGVKE